MYFPTTRVLTVLELLQSHGRMSGSDLAKRLEVNSRTIRRYITMLQDLGIPVESERGRHGSYRLRPGFKLPPLMFTNEEALALTLGLLAARKFHLMEAAPAIEGALAKVERVLPAELQQQIKAVQETLVFDTDPAETRPSPDIITRLSMSAQAGERVLIRYRSWRGNETERELDPYALVYQSSRWYAIGYCHHREELRMFRLDRIITIERRFEKFERPDDFDPLGYVARSLAMMPSTWLIEIVLDAPLEELQQQLPQTLATLELIEEGVLLRCWAGSLEWFALILLGLNYPMKIRQPAELRDVLRDLAKRSHAIADSSEDAVEASRRIEAN